MKAVRPASSIPSLASVARLTSQQSRQRHLRRGLLLCLTALGHAIAIAATLAFAKLHNFIQASLRLTFDIDQLGTHLIDYFDSVKIMCYIATSVHAATLLYAVQDFICLWLCPSRRFSSSRTWASMKSFRSIQASHKPREKSLIKKRCWRRAYKRFDRTVATYHAEITQFRLLVEVIMQTYQASKMSNLVATVWLNRVLVLVIVGNCWFTPLIYALMRHQTPHARRVVRLSVDTVLDIVYSFGIPCVIILPYVSDFVPSQGSFPLEFYITDTWTTVTGSELQQLFMSSWWDFVSKVSPWFFFSYRLHALRRIIDDDNQKALEGVEVNARRTRLSRLLNNSLLLWGLGILVAHLQTTFVANTSSALGCLVEMRPWFKTSYTCTVLEMSCSQRRISGAKAEVQAAFSEFTADRVQGLIISHCPRFEMPATILSFSALVLLKFYNTTISDWGADAMLTARTNPNIQQFFAIYTNFTTFPDGLLSREMPKTMRDVKLVGTNLTSLPMALRVAWSSTKYFTVESSLNMPEFPPVLAAMPETLFVSFPDSGLHHLSETVLRDLNVLFMTLEGNPITSLPEHIGNIDKMFIINMKRSSLRELPASWQRLQRESPLEIIADGTPLCEQLQAGNASPPAKLVIGTLRITCIDTIFIDGVYPVARERSWREASRYPVN